MLEESPDIVYVEHCVSCSSHSWCTNHDEEKYKEYYEKCKNSILNLDLNLNVVENEIPLGFDESRRIFDGNSWKSKSHFPRIGAFEVFFKGKCLFSKLSSMRWPNVEWLAERVKEILENPDDFKKSNRKSKSFGVKTTFRSRKGKKMRSRNVTVLDIDSPFKSVDQYTNSNHKTFSEIFKKNYKLPSVSREIIGQDIKIPPKISRPKKIEFYTSSTNRTSANDYSKLRESITSKESHRNQNHSIESSTQPKPSDIEKKSKTRAKVSLKSQIPSKSSDSREEKILQKLNIRGNYSKKSKQANNDSEKINEIENLSKVTRIELKEPNKNAHFSKLNDFGLLDQEIQKNDSNELKSSEKFDFEKKVKDYPEKQSEKIRDDEEINEYQEKIYQKEREFEGKIEENSKEISINKNEHDYVKTTDGPTKEKKISQEKINKIESSSNKIEKDKIKITKNTNKSMSDNQKLDIDIETHQKNLKEKIEKNQKDETLVDKSVQEEIHKGFDDDSSQNYREEVQNEIYYLKDNKQIYNKESSESQILKGPTDPTIHTLSHNKVESNYDSEDKKSRPESPKFDRTSSKNSYSESARPPAKPTEAEFQSKKSLSNSENAEKLSKKSLFLKESKHDSDNCSDDSDQGYYEEDFENQEKFEDNKKIEKYEEKSEENEKKSEENEEKSEENEEKSEENEEKSEKNEEKSDENEEKSEENEEKSEENEEKSDENEEKSEEIQQKIKNEEENSSNDERNSDYNEEDFENDDKKSENNEEDFENDEKNSKYHEDDFEDYQEDKSQKLNSANNLEMNPSQDSLDYSKTIPNSKLPLSHPKRPISKSFIVKLPLFQETKKKINYENQSDFDASFIITSSDPDQMEVREELVEIPKGIKSKIQLKFSPVEADSENKYYLYIDRDGFEWECIEIVAVYSDVNTLT